ncbi:NAD-dependent epimerase/dehydratase family protein [Horticoccus luteus]|uniref:NAD-dependent epimerase/dehydratase family protein n=1 Tax=Horticoccus luteus TaxID=2862869 RepID=A0A8F9TVV8_9BACT|nr:NAD-dependent epimerase/dehydratase family protein [Horticoccus luteus]QYM79032.1 NAD-dependent epimerase/dehydratase family protein [Horticoccus luteus]
MKSPDSSLLGPALVTGGTGFLGSHVVEKLLDQGRSVTVLARNPAPTWEARGVRFVRAALEDSAAVAEACAGMATVFHVAAKVGVWGRYGDFYRANVLGTRAIIEGCRRHAVPRLVYTSTPSVVYTGSDLAGVDESLPLTTSCPSPYPLTKAMAEREVLAANSATLRTVALRPHLIWGAGDPHLVPRLLARARAGRLRIIGAGRNRVDLVHVQNASVAHLLAETALSRAPSPAAGRAYFITNDDPVLLWEWINQLLSRMGLAEVKKRVPLPIASAAGAVAEEVWRGLALQGEPPLTRFVAAELAKDHWFNVTAAKRDLLFHPAVSMSAGMESLVESLRA